MVSPWQLEGTLHTPGFSFMFSSNYDRLCNIPCWWAFYCGSSNTLNTSASKVNQYNHLSTVTFNFDYVFFLAFIVISLKFVCRTESVRQRKHWVGHKNGKKKTFLWQTDESFVTLTQCHKLVLRKWQKVPKKETWAKLKITVLRKLDWGTLNLFSIEWAPQ